MGEPGGLHRPFIDLGDFNGNWREAYFVLVTAWIKHLAIQGLSY